MGNNAESERSVFSSPGRPRRGAEAGLQSGRACGEGLWEEAVTSEVPEEPAVVGAGRGKAIQRGRAL